MLDNEFWAKPESICGKLWEDAQEGLIRRVFIKLDIFNGESAIDFLGRIDFVFLE